MGGIIDRDVDAIQLSIRRFESWSGWRARFLSDLRTEIYLYACLQSSSVSYVIKRKNNLCTADAVIKIQCSVLGLVCLLHPWL